MVCRNLLILLMLLFSQFAHSGAYDDMLKAVNMHDADQVSALLQRGMDVNTSDSEGNTLLLLAARNSDSQILETLLINKANVLKINKYGDSALMLAALRGPLQNVKALVQAGADIDPEGWTPLIYAAFEGHVDIVTYLLTLDLDINAQSANGISALMAASRNGHLEVVKILLEHRADLNLANQDNKSARALAMERNQNTIAELLLKAATNTDNVHYVK